MTDDSKNIRLIKKYPNRRLYDTLDSRYITLDDAKQMVVDGVAFKVLDQKSGEDLTRSILLQIIMEQENNGEPLFNTEVLSQFIRNYGESSRENFTSFLSASMKLFSEQQTAMMSQMDQALSGTPLDFWMKMSQQNMDNFQKMQKQFFDSGSKDSKK